MPFSMPLSYRVETKTKPNSVYRGLNHFLRSKVLAGLVASGCRMDAICAILGLHEEFVLDEVVKLGLSTPSSTLRPRKTTSRSWRFDEIGQLILGWTAAMPAKSISVTLMRSTGAIYSKARALGLPPRSRSEVLANLRSGLSPDSISDRPAEKQPAIIDACGKRIEIDFINGRGHIKWTPAMDHELSRRHWAYQRLDVVAAEWGVSATTLSSRAHRLELPARERALLVSHFDPSVVEANISAARYVLRTCRVKTDWSFWAHRNGARVSRCGDKIRSRSGGGYGLGVSHSMPSMGASFSL